MNPYEAPQSQKTESQKPKAQMTPLQTIRMVIAIIGIVIGITLDNIITVANQSRSAYYEIYHFQIFSVVLSICVLAFNLRNSSSVTKIASIAMIILSFVIGLDRFMRTIRWLD